ncbi:hypothetical protein [Aureimonas mangrovi]|uniref:hypothetical protein n=1 Tax=Aureimonas mangrovi TaxID=2758041 RepID=UPI00163D6613|nr:hypothetical protein [Aureimonas mangrovi]
MRSAGTPELLRPTASPVDSYVRPAPSGLNQLAGALAQLDPALRAFTDQRAQRFRDEEAKRAEADHFRNNEEGYAEAVRTGQIPAHHSRTYMRTYKAAEGATIGRNLQHRYRAAWDAWEGKNAEDPDGSLHAGFLQEFIRSNVGTNDPDVLAGVLPAVRSLQESATSADIKYRGDRAYLGSITAHTARINQHIDDGDDAGLLSPEGTNYPGVFAAAFAERERIVASGARPEDFDKAMMEAFAAKAVEKGDAGLLAWFDQTVPGQDYTYGDTADGQALRLQTLERLETVERQYASDAHTRQTREDAAAKDAATRTAIDLLAAGEPVPEELLAAGQRVDPTFRTRIGEWRKNLAERSSDPDVLMSVYDAVLRGGGVKAVVDAFDAGAISNPEDLTKLHTFAKGFEENEDRIEDALGSAAARRLLDTIDVQTKGSTDFGDPVGGTSREGLEAQYDFRRMVMEWAIANPDASAYEREEALGRFGKIILDRIQPSTNPLDKAAAGTYERGEERFPNPYTEGPVAGPETAPTTIPPAPAPPDASGLLSPSVKPADGEAQLPNSGWFDGLPDWQKGIIRSYADRSGMSLEDATRAIRERSDPSYKPMSAHGDGGAAYQPAVYDPSSPDMGDGDSRSLGLTPEQASAFLDEALAANTVDTAPGSAFVANDPSASRLLNLIGQHEAAGNYNAVYGRAGSKRDLSALTLDQVLGEQQAARKRGAASTAIGRYQFIFKTLRGLKSELGLSGKERFTPELQDRLAMQLLERRGYSAFRAGRISQRQFALRLSQEWASLANPSTGRSFYAGDGLNASSASASDVYRALGLIRT